MKELNNNFIIEIVFPALYIQNTAQLYSHECASSTGYKVLKKFLFLCLLLKLLHLVHLTLVYSDKINKLKMKPINVCI